METMRKFKVGDEIVRVSVETSWAHIGYKSTVLENYVYLCKDGEYTPINDGQWELAKPKWTIYNNAIPWGKLTNVKKGEMLLANHSGIEIKGVGFLSITQPVIFDCEHIAYFAVKPEPTMEDLFNADCSESNTRFSLAKQMIAKGWNKSCK
jgi:hypothetical protein